MAAPEHNEQEPLGVADLTRVYFRTQDKAGKFINVDAMSATDKQFDTWAKSRVFIAGQDTGTWSLAERASFCNHLWQHGALVILKKDVTREDEGEENISLLTRTHEDEP